MDAVEMPLPANIVVSKFLAADGFGRSCKAEDASKSMLDVGVAALDGSCSSVRDVKRPVTHLEQSSIPWKGSDPELHNTSSFIVKDGARSFREAKHSFLSSPEYLVNHVKKQQPDMRKRRVICSKKQRMSRLDGSSSSIGAEDNYSIDGKTSSHFARRNPACNADNLHLVKQKYSQNGRKKDKWVSKMAAKKWDSSNPKSCHGSLYSVSSEKTFCGIPGLKQDLSDSYSDDLSLDALLDGSHEFTVATKGKEKKVNDVNACIMRTVNNVFSILPISDRIQLQKNDEHDSNSRHMSGARWSPSDCSYCPTEILEQLKLPPSKGIDSLLLELRNTTGVIMQSNNADINSARQIPRSIYMLPFPWSLPHSGSSKATFDSGRLLTSNTYWQRWVKIRSKTASHGNSGNSSFQGLNLLPQHSTENSKLETGCLVNDRALLSSSIALERPVAISSYNCKSWCSFPRVDVNGHVHFEKSQAVCGSSASIGNILGKNEGSSFIVEKSEGKFDCHTDGGCFSLLNSRSGICDQHKQHLSSMDCLDVSLLAAAEILCELAGSYSNAFVGHQHRNCGRHRYISHKPPPQNPDVSSDNIRGEHVENNQYGGG